MPTSTKDNPIPILPINTALPPSVAEAACGPQELPPDESREETSVSRAGEKYYSPEFRAGRFKPGHSGNPNGRKRYDNEIRKMLVDGSKEAVKALCEIVSNKKSNDKARCLAAQIILDRVYGKATLPINAVLGGGDKPVVFEFKGILDEWAK